ncbi:exocyst complex component SEC8 isoform X1 [Ananas comosus]|uniref:Exocyst complex component Sec8 n=1 Tax=Ananas comosus TaxID=4615 RepID=A0A6P5F3E8_ANACO|nr:exocyst complex component SEC8 isoform X1 [Ananas comosus]XP_020090163.1 exocyst complex component SEC8 isoform X1 [Ananas comosus]
MSSGRGKGIFDGLPIPADKSYLREGLSRIDESWAAARFDSLPHVVHILTSKDCEGEIQFLREQSDLVEDIVDEVVHAYHHGFNKAIQNYSQILRLFSESTESISVLKVDMAEAKKLLGSRNKQLRQLWYRSLTLRHILALLDQIESVAKVPARIEKLVAEKQLYAAVQLHVQSMLMLEREGLQVVGALQDVRSELTKLRGVLFYKILEELHSHLYSKGEYSSATLNMLEGDEALTTAAIGYSLNSTQPQSRRTRSMKGDNHFGGPASVDGFLRTGSVDGSSSFDGHDDESSLEMHEGGPTEGHRKDYKSISREIPSWLSSATPDEFLESMKKSDASLSVKYLRTLVECLCMLGKVAAAGAMICQRLRPTIHDIITSKIKAYSEQSSSRSRIGQASKTNNSDLYYSKGLLESYQLSKQKAKNGTSFLGTQLAISPISPAMTPMGTAQCAASELLSSVLESIVLILENHIIVGELLETKSSTQGDSINTPKVSVSDANWNPDSESNQVTGGFSVAFSLTVINSECQQLICEILRATPEAATADAAVQTARLANKAPVKEKRDGSEGLSFAFRFIDTAVSVPNEDVYVDFHVNGREGSNFHKQPKMKAGQGWRRGPNVQQEGYGTAAVLPDQGIYLAASVYRPILQFTDKIGEMLPQKYSQLGNDGLLAFVENFLKDHFLPAMFVDYRKSVQQAISSPAAFRPRAHPTSVYSPLVEKGRPVLQGLLAIDSLAKEVLGWAQLMPKYASELVEYVHTFLERTHERCRTSYMEAVLEKQSYMLLGRSDVESFMRLDPANACLQSSSGQSFENNIPDAETVEVEIEMSDLLLSLRPIKQENLIHDDQKLILLASLSDSLEYLADSIERLGESFIRPPTSTEDRNHTNQAHKHTRTASALPKSLASLATEYRKLAIDCLKVLRLEMQLETIFHMQEMTNREYLEDQDAEEPDDFVISLTTLITRRDEEMAPFIAELKRNYIFGGICNVATNASIKALAEIKSINLLGVQQICRNSIALEQALAAIPSIDNDAVQQRLDRVRTYYELLNLPFEALLAFITEHEYLFTTKEYSSLLKVNVPGREVPPDAEQRISEILGH